MSANSRQQNRAMAAYLKEKFVTRDAGRCPWGCGRMIANGGERLLAHLNGCRGNPRARSASERRAA